MNEQETTTETADGQSSLTNGLGAWLPIATAPKHEVFIVSDGETVSVGWWSGDGWANWLPAKSRPTHWMPLPEAPNVDVS